jgi:hypothetical protein
MIAEALNIFGKLLLNEEGKKGMVQTFQSDLMVRNLIGSFN